MSNPIPPEIYNPIRDRLLEHFTYDDDAELARAVITYDKHFDAYQRNGGRWNFEGWLKAWEFFGTEETEKGVQLPVVRDE